MKKEKDKHRQVGGGEKIYKTESKLKKNSQSQHLATIDHMEARSY